MQWTSHLGYAASGEDFRKHRKWLQSAFLAHNSLVKYRPIQLREVRVLLDGMSGSSSQFEQHLNRCVPTTHTYNSIVLAADCRTDLLVPS